MITLAADWGGRRIKLGLVRDGRVLAMRVLDAQSEQPLKYRLEVVESELKELCAGQGIDASQCDGVSFAYPSVIDTLNAKILDHFGKFGDAAELDLRSWAKRALNLPLAIDNDARMALIGEWQYGAARGCDNVVIMTLGTGIGAAVVLEGRVLRGAHGQVGILGGHLTLNYKGRQCVCGNLGCAETEASTWVLERLARERDDYGRSPLKGLSPIDYSAVFRRAAEGDPCALALRDHSLLVWSTTAINLIHAYDPEKLVLAGGVMASGQFIVPAVQEQIRRYAHTPWGSVQVLPSQLGDHAALLAGEWLLEHSTCHF